MRFSLPIVVRLFNLFKIFMAAIYTHINLVLFVGHDVFCQIKLIDDAYPRFESASVPSSTVHLFVRRHLHKTGDRLKHAS